MTSDTISSARVDAEPTGAAAATLDAVRALAPAIATRVDEIERGRRLPPDLVADLRDAGCFRLLVPKSHGGAEVTVADHMRVMRELARVDGSVAWTVMLGSSAPVILGMLPRVTFDDIYAEGPDVVLAGTFNPTGVASPVEGGFRANGRWSFASGCQHADWFVAHCFVDDGRMPPLRMMVVPADEVEIIDTWTVSGLCGTGSNDFTIDGVFVPEERTFSIFEEGGLDGPLGRIPELSFSSLEFANVAIGMAEGALAEITTLATGKVPMFADATLAANPLFRHRLGEADAHLRAADALLDSTVASTWQNRGDRRGVHARTPRVDANDRHMGDDRGGSSRRHGIQRRWRNCPVLEQSLTTASARRTRDHAALRRQARHVHAGGRGARRPGRGPQLLVMRGNR